MVLGTHMHHLSWLQFIDCSEDYDKDYYKDRGLMRAGDV